MALHRALGSAAVARGLEAAAGALGLTRRLGLARHPAPGARVAERRPTRPWALALFRRSVLKQRKLAEIVRRSGADRGPALPGPRLRQRRRQPAAARARRLVGLGRPHRRRPWPRSASWWRATCICVDGGAPARSRTPSSTRSSSWTCWSTCRTRPPSWRELARVTRPGGRLVVNTPHLKRTLLRRLRHALGQTDEKHGHLRPGYTPERLRELLGRPLRAGAAPHLLALLLGAGGHRDQLGRRARWASGLRQGHGRDGRRPRASTARLFRPYSWSTRWSGRVSGSTRSCPASGYMLIATARRR